MGEICVKKTNWPLLMLMSGATSAWLFYDMTTATEAPRMALALLQYLLLAMSTVSFLGAVVMCLEQIMTRDRS
jgi:hypothetical protein